MFFFNPTVNSDHKIFYNLSRKFGVVFFCNEKTKHFYKKIQPFVKWCIRKGIKFIAPHSTYWAYRNSAFGVLVDLHHPHDFYTPDLKIIKSVFIATKVHNIKEARNAIKFSNIIFISPIFKTNSHPRELPISRYILIKLSLFFKEQMIFGLGGVNEYNFKLVKKYNLYGYGGISNFRK